MAKQYGMKFYGTVRVFRKDKEVQAAGSKKKYDISDLWVNVSEKNEDGSYFNKSMPVIIKRGLVLPENNTVIDFSGFPMISGNVKGDKDYRRIVLYVEDWNGTDDERKPSTTDVNKEYPDPFAGESIDITDADLPF